MEEVIIFPSCRHKYNNILPLVLVQENYYVLQEYAPSLSQRGGPIPLYTIITRQYIPTLKASNIKVNMTHNLIRDGKSKNPFNGKTTSKDTVVRNFTIRKVVITIYLQDSCIVRPIVTSANIMYAFLPQQFQRWYLPNINCLLKLLIRMSQNLWYFKEVSKHSRKDLCDFRKCLKLKAYWNTQQFFLFLKQNKAKESLFYLGSGTGRKEQSLKCLDLE